MSLVCGVGVNNKPGWSVSVGYKQKCYTLWKNILSRCYNPNSPNYKWYGAKGYTVCTRWLTFSNFVEDLPKLVGYASWKYGGKREYDIEKDTISRPLGILEYAPYCCFFARKVYNLNEEWARNPNLANNYVVMQTPTAIRNCRIANSSPVMGVNRTTGDIVIFESTRDAERSGNFKHGSVVRCINGVLTHYKNYVWSYISKEKFISLGGTFK